MQKVTIYFDNGKKLKTLISNEKINNYYRVDRVFRLSGNDVCRIKEIKFEW